MTLERIFGAEDPSVADAAYRLAEAQRVRGEFAEAERLYWRSVMIRSYLHGSNHASLWPPLKGLADLNRALGRGGEAQKLYARAASIAERSLPASMKRARLYDFVTSDSETAAIGRGSSASLLVMPGAPLSEREAVHSSEQPELAHQLESLSEIYRAQGKLLEAIDAMRRVLLIRERGYPAGHPVLARTYDVMAGLLAEQRGEPPRGGKTVPAPVPQPAAPR